MLIRRDNVLCHRSVCRGAQQVPVVIVIVISCHAKYLREEVNIYVVQGHRLRDNDSAVAQSKITKFFDPCKFYTPLTGFRLELGIDARNQKTRIMAEKNV